MGDAHILLDAHDRRTFRYSVRGTARLSRDRGKQSVHARHERFALGGRAGRKDMPAKR
jgi:hypothetical protein